MVFRKIEYAIEGDGAAQRRLDKEPWSASKLGKKTLKHLIFILISILIAHTVLAYIIGAEKTMLILNESPTHNLAGFISMLAFTGTFYFVYAKFREQACIAVPAVGVLLPDSMKVRTGSL